MTKREDDIGKHGQNLARSVLDGLGIECLEKIGTPIKAIPMGKVRGQEVWQVIWGEKVAGDHRGVLPGGRSVLIETKTIVERNLVWSDFREHQPGKLSAHDNMGGLSLVVWVHSPEVYVMEWPITGFGPGKGITPALAEILDKIARGNLREACRTCPHGITPVANCPSCRQF